MKKILLISLFITSICYSYGQAGAKWATDGNGVSSGDFLGSTNNQAVIFKTNNLQRMSLSTTGVLQLNNLSGTGNRFIQTDATGNIIPFTMGTSAQVLYGNGIWGSLPTPPSVFWNSSGSNIYFNTGNVGVGTTSPMFPLDVIGDVRISNNLYVGGGIVISDKVNVNAEVVTGKMQADSIVTDSTKGFYGTSKFNGDVKLQNKLSVNGNVNISSLASSIPLQMVVVDNLGNLKLMGPSACCTMAWLTGGNVVATVAESFIGTCNSMPLRFGTNTFEHMRITPGGFIGIGTTNPLAPFYVQVPTTFMSSVGIGTTSPTCDLEIAKAGPVSSCNYSTTPDDATMWVKNSLFSYGLNVDNVGNGHILFNVNSPAPAITINTQGQVGVATTYIPPGFEFAVEGEIICEEVKVKLRANWPDYVFDKNYKLLTIQELDAYISTNKHLPNIPSSFDVKNDGGISVGEMQAKLLEKIEEMSLYIIEQNKRIEKLENK